MESGILTEAKATELAELMEATNPADLTRGITAIQTQLIALAAAKTLAWKHHLRERRWLRHALQCREHLDMRRYVLKIRAHRGSPSA
ncbi:hypothetical protein HC749_06170 [Arthrobacter sp. S13_S34]|nr:hypothetical protein [Arthrobacter sp. S13_S34]